MDVDFYGHFLTGSSWHARFLANRMKNKVFDEESKPIGEKFQFNAIPFSVGVDKDGNIVSYEEVNKYVDEIAN